MYSRGHDKSDWRDGDGDGSWLLRRESAGAGALRPREERRGGKIGKIGSRNCRSKVGEFLGALFGARDAQRLLLVVVEVGRVSRSLRLGSEWRLHLQARAVEPSNEARGSEVSKVTGDIHVLAAWVEGGLR